MWKVTEDRLFQASSTFPSRKGQAGYPYRLVRFRLFDDDGELYYAGILEDDEDCLNQSDALKWGAMDAGCTTIKVFRNGEWKQEIG